VFRDSEWWATCLSPSISHVLAFVSNNNPRVNFSAVTLSFFISSFFLYLKVQKVKSDEYYKPEELFKIKSKRFMKININHKKTLHTWAGIHNFWCISSNRRSVAAHYGLMASRNEVTDWMIQCRIWGSPAAVMKRTIFWDITPCSLSKVNRHFGGRYRLHFQGRINRARFQRRKQVASPVIGLPEISDYTRSRMEMEEEASVPIGSPWGRMKPLGSHPTTGRTNRRQGQSIRWLWTKLYMVQKYCHVVVWL
jgi:hypothetical protein